MKAGTVVSLDDWSAVASPYTAPEIRRIHLVGRITGHPVKQDGKMVRTSAVVSAEGRLVRTAGGTTYRLGEPSKLYREWLREHRPNWNPEQPITLLGVN